MTAIVKRDLVQTGIQWIGEIPPSWKVKSLKRNTYIKARVGWKGLTSDEFEIDSYAYLVTGSDFKEKRIELKNCYQVDEKRYLDDPFIQLEDGDLLVTKDGSIGKVAVVDGLDKPACLNSGVFVVRPTQEYISEFLYWVLTSKVFTEFINLNSSGSTIQHLYQNVFQDFSFAFPDKEQQRQIVEYLDRETAQIDALIEKQQQLIETLTEQRKAVITRAVTRGLDPTVPLKDSGLYWAPLIPETWIVDRLARHFTAAKGKNAALLTKEFCGEIPGPFPVYSGQTTNGGVMAHIDSYEFDSGEEGVLLSTTVGSGLVMTLNHIRGKFSLSQNCMVISRRGDLNTSFYRWQLSAMFDAKRGELSGDMQTSFRMSDLYSYKILRPPASEQAQIAKFLETETLAIEGLRSKAGEMIRLLQERRQALISAVVTGKIDVRGK